METENLELLIKGARDLGFEFGERETGLFDQYLSLLDKWASKINLTAINGERNRVTRLILDSLNVAPLIDDGMRVIDVGSGAGLPGIPVKIARPGVELVLCESRQKRSDFLKEVARKLGLPGVSVFDARAEQWDGQEFDAALVRGVGAIDEIVKICSPLVRPGGSLVAMKGPAAEEELRDLMEPAGKLGFSIREIRPYDLPGHDASFNLVILDKA